MTAEFDNLNATLKGMDPAEVAKLVEQAMWQDGALTPLGRAVAAISYAQGQAGAGMFAMLVSQARSAQGKKGGRPKANHAMIRKLAAEVRASKPDASDSMVARGVRRRWPDDAGALPSMSTITRQLRVSADC